jgi:hypothetical protein
MTDHTFDIVVSTRDNQEWIETYLLSYIKFTSNPYRYNIRILDSSTEENYTKLVNIVNAFDLNISIIRYNRTIHYHDIWTNGISLCYNNFVLITHADIVYLYKNWDLFLIEKINTDYNLISVSVRTKKYPESVFILSEKKILTISKFEHSRENQKLIEHGMIMENQKKTLGLHYYIKDSIYYKKYGDIALLDNKEFIYHSYYSSRIKPDTNCPVPYGPETTYLSNRQPFDETIKTIKLFLQSDNSLKDYF